MFGILWPSGNFMAFLSYAIGFIRCRDTLGGVVPLPLLAAQSSALHKLLFGAERRLLSRRSVQGSWSRQTRPFSPSTGWATPQGQAADFSGAHISH